MTRRGRGPLSVFLPERMRGHYGTASGDARMWTNVVSELERLGTRIEHADPARRPLLRRQPDVWLTNGHAGALDVSPPVVAHLHEAPWLEPERIHSLDPAFRADLRERSQAAADTARAIITPSEFSRRQVIEAHGVRPDVVHAVPHGVDGEVYRPERAPEGRRIVAAAGCAAPYVAFVGTVHPRKNLPVLKEAMSVLAARGSRHALVLVLSPAGDRTDSEELIRDAQQPVPGLAGGTFILRALSEPELAGLLAAADAVCVPSRSEGFGLVALEAMACGSPVVVSDRGALPEVVGPEGMVVEPDPGAVAAALAEVLGDGCCADRLRAAGLERSRSFTWAASAAGWLEVLEAAAS